MKIGEVVERSGVSHKALRLYEARGILPSPRRTVSGYRVYADDVISLLDFIQQGQRLGLTLAEIKHIISLRRSGAAPCAHVRRLLAQKEADLKALLAEVRRILKAWPLTDGLHAAICPHIEARGGDTVWKSTRSAPGVPRAWKSSSTTIRSASVKMRTRPSSRGRNGTSLLT
jgi:DNA-binding transcriptional MerR regulator